jgi:hypothetical protein
MCDTLCASRTGGMLFAKNSDRPVNEPQVVEVLPVHRPATDGRVHTQYLTIDDPGPGQLTVASRPTWLWGAEHAVNAAGVAIGNEKVWTTDDPHVLPPALIGMDLVRLVAERATSADDAVDLLTSLLERWGQGGSGEQHADEPYWSSFLVVDPTGGWVVETSGRTWVAEPVTPGAGRSLSNRLVLATGWTRSSTNVPAGFDWQSRRSPDVPTAIADHRLAATSRLITPTPVVASATDGPSARTVLAGLRDHGDGPWGAPGDADAVGIAPPGPVPVGLGDDLSGVTVCMHVRDYQCTTATMIADLPEDPDDPLRLWAAVGPPCSTAALPGVVIRRGEPEAVVPTVLSEPATWAHASAAARDAEQPGDDGLASLAATRRRVGTVEAQAWDEADELAERHASATEWRAAAERWSAALHSVTTPRH